uniref:Secreted protein n=1 Tax=Myripristis murdjan TaxID=586833 RepID=A0A668ABS8_9TELE
MNSLTKLGGQFLGLCLLQLSDAGCGFGAHDATTPNQMNAHLLVSVIVVGLDGFHKLGKCTFVLPGKDNNFNNTVHTLTLISN